MTLAVLPTHPGILRLRATYAAAITPSERLSIVEWAERYQRTSSKSSAEPGKYTVERTPYMREIMEAMSEDYPAEIVVGMLCSQGGKSQSLLNTIGYVIHHAPGPMLVVQPSVERAVEFGKERIAPMIADVPELRALVADPKSRESGNTLQVKEFPGGILTLVGANAPSGLASKPIRWLLLDEVDRFEASAGTEGNPIEIAIKRTTTFGTRRKVIMFSTPTVEGASAICDWFALSDQREWRMPCPHCGEFQTLEWEGLRWEPGRAATAHYVCEVNGCVIEEHAKATMLPGGRWEAQAESEIPGFRMSALCLPLGWASWAELVREYERAVASGDPEKLKTFYNTRLCRTFDESADYSAPDGWDESRTEAFPAPCPAGVAVLTAGVDVQHDRLEVEVVGWGVGEESWSVDYRILSGDPGQPAVWQDLDALLATRYRHETHAPLPIAVTCVDSSDGNHSESVWTYCQARFGRRVYAVKGSSDRSAPIWPRKPTTTGKGRFRCWVVGVHAIKDRVIPRLRIALRDDGTAPPGFCHVPRGRIGEWFAQMRSEVKEQHIKAGRSVAAWVPKRRRNEALDCRVYSYAGLHSLLASGYALQALLDARTPRADDSSAVARPQARPQPTVRGGYMSRFANGGRG